jgi:lysyl-tRNA synthetase class 2
MTAANFISARDLFLSHHWKRYPPFEKQNQFGDRSYKCGRVVGRDREEFVIREANSSERFEIRLRPEEMNWHRSGLREPSALESAPPVHEVLRVGDWIGISQVAGPASGSDFGRIAAKNECILFSPCLRPVAIQEADLLLDKTKSWGDFLNSVRQFFLQRDFSEATTPSLAVSPGTEPFLEPLAVDIEFSGETFRRYLVTSPEFHLKKILGAGQPRVFEIAKCFRNKEGGDHHRIEFFMLEWYRSFAALDEIAADVEALIQKFSPNQSLERKTMSELFREYVDFDLKADTGREDLVRVAARLGVRALREDTFDDLFHKIFLEKIELKLRERNSDGPVLITGYPPSQAALSRIGETGFAERFEVYWRGLELCNAFHELNDPAENKKRFDRDNFLKNQSGRPTVPLDEELMRTFDHGVPPAAGIALGLERLYMASFEVESIELVRPFSAFV